MSDDPVNNPTHYNQNGIEVIDVIETYAKNDFRLANVIKYVCRSGYKGNKLQDLKKAQWYLNRAVADLELKETFETYVSPSPERIAGDNEAATRIKNEYYQYDGDEVIAHCANAACRAPISRSDIYVLDDAGVEYCCSTCQMFTRNADHTTEKA